MLVLDSELNVVSVSQQAERWLARMSGPVHGGLPVPVHAAAARLVGDGDGDGVFGVGVSSLRRFLVMAGSDAVYGFVEYVEAAGDVGAGGGCG